MKSICTELNIKNTHCIRQHTHKNQRETFSLFDFKENIKIEQKNKKYSHYTLFYTSSTEKCYCVVCLRCAFSGFFSVFFFFFIFLLLLPSCWSSVCSLSVNNFTRSSIISTTLTMVDYFQRFFLFSFLK